MAACSFDDVAKTPKDTSHPWPFPILSAWPYLSSRKHLNRCLLRPGVVFEAEDHRAAKEPGGRYEYCDEKQRDSEGHSGPAAVWAATEFAQHQHQPSRGNGGRPEPAVRHHDPGGVGQAKASQEPTEGAWPTAVRVPNQMQ